MPQARRLFVRALLALVLMVGFYALALGLVAVLVWIPYAEWTYLHRVHPKLALACLAGALAVLVAVWPRPDRFEPPGPELDASRHPRLFSLLDDVARATGQHMPGHVYLLPDVNAFVTHRGGVMGVGSRKVMGIGLPLLQGLTVQQLRGVIAHEFGHYVGGDVALSPWIHKTRASIGRAIEQFGDGTLSTIFNGYGRLFMRVTMAISRRQEYVADEVAARVAGVAPMKAALRQVTVLATTHAAYFHTMVVPVLQRGFLPALAGGFDRFRTTTRFIEASAAILEHAMSKVDTGTFDSHPALRDRLAALDALPSPSALTDNAPASTLVDDVEAMARELLAFSAGEEVVGRLRAIDWPAVPTAVYRPAWEAVVEKHRQRLSTLTTAAMPSGRAAFHAFGRTLFPRTHILSDEEYLKESIGAIGSALAMLLVSRGWAIAGEMGSDGRLTRAGDAIEPFAVARQLADGTLDAAAWATQCRKAGIDGVSLA